MCPGRCVLGGCVLGDSVHTYSSLDTVLFSEHLLTRCPDDVEADEEEEKTEKEKFPFEISGKSSEGNSSGQRGSMKVFLSEFVYYIYLFLFALCEHILHF